MDKTVTSVSPLDMHGVRWIHPAHMFPILTNSAHASDSGHLDFLPVVRYKRTRPCSTSPRKMQEDIMPGIVIEWAYESDGTCEEYIDDIDPDDLDNLEPFDHIIEPDYHSS